VFEPGRQALRLSVAVATATVLVALAQAGSSDLAGGGSIASAAPATPGAKAAAKRKPSPAQLRKQRRANRRQKRPNVIVVMTDDQSNDMLGLGGVVNRIGGRGTTFRNSYASFPLCCPSRATLLTGQYSHNHGVVRTDLPNGYNGLDHRNTLAVWLRRAGYRTAMVGKYLNGYGLNDGISERRPDAREIPPGWNDWYALTNDTDQKRYRFQLNENGKIRHYGKGAKNYVTDVLSAKALKIVARRAPVAKPFFLWFNPTAPHGERGAPANTSRKPRPAPRHQGRFDSLSAPHPPNFNEADVSDKPDFVRNLPLFTPEEVADFDRRYRGRAESLLSVDQAVKRLLARLKKAGDIGKTYVFFTSDNGLMMGAHRLTLKNYLYEEDTRVPLLVRGPRFPAGAVRDQLVSNVDLAPTIVELTGATAGRTMDGRSLIGPAADAAVGAGRELLLELEGVSAIRSGKWVFIDRPASTTDELYDLEADPFQLQSQHANPAPPYPVMLAQLQARLNQIRACAGAACP
jgi:arylsulfatase A-like enzyme